MKYIYIYNIKIYRENFGLLLISSGNKNQILAEDKGRNETMADYINSLEKKKKYSQF